ncbi:MAG: PilZ domain-containing protein [Nitrospinae bacterium]|nr:PilZ domain-containing protein [Nitrospinota bacterium]
MRTDSVDENSQLRDYVRVAVSFPVTFSFLKENDYERIRNVIISHRTGDREGDIMPLLGMEELESLDIAIAKIWMSMNSKLDYIIKLLKKDKKEEKENEGFCTDISGKGIKMIYKGDLSIGQYIQLRVHPPTFPPITIVALGKILRKEKSDTYKEGEIEVAVEFDTIHGDDREEIVSYVFKRQRELLRAKKEI